MEGFHFSNLISLSLIGRALLKKYTTAEQCGTWNSNILKELNADNEFQRNSFLLHDQAASSGLEATVAIDGNDICRIEIEYQKCLTVFFSLSFLGPRYFISPAFFTVSLDNKTSDFGLAEYGCGKLNPDGVWCTANSRDCIMPEDRTGWAVLRSCRFGNRGLAERVRDLKRRR